MNTDHGLNQLPVTVLLATRNEELNLRKCLSFLRRAERVVVMDSGSKDQTVAVAEEAGVEIVQFRYAGGYPRKRQWVLEHVAITTPWVMFLDADEEVSDELWDDIERAISQPSPCFGYTALKAFHFLGRRFRFGGFSHSAMLLVRFGYARFERLLDCTDDGLDMEVHERVIIDGPIGHLKTPIMHRDFKGVEAYRKRHRQYAVWESHLRYQALTTGNYGVDSVRPSLFGNAQERRRFIKHIAMRVPFEPLWWFLYHYVFRLALLEGRAGWTACCIRYEYIRDVRAGVRRLKKVRSAGA